VSTEGKREGKRWVDAEVVAQRVMYAKTVGGSAECRIGTKNGSAGRGGNFFLEILILDKGGRCLTIVRKRKGTAWGDSGLREQ